MVYLLVADQKPFRAEKIGEVLSRFEASELVTVDDTSLAVADLEQFLFPSLFFEDVPVILARFLLSGEECAPAFIKKMVASPTVFIFEELQLPASTVTLFKKAGAVIETKEKEKKKAPSTDIFAAAKCLTEKDKKARWLAYRAALEQQPIEAILGILYWKARTLAAKGPQGNAYELLYRDLLKAQARAWKSGAPLEALIEKVILT